MAAFDTCDCSESEFTTHDFCSVFRSCFDCVIWHIQLGRSRREDIIVLRKTFYEYVADSYAVLYDICANTCIRIKECVCNHVDISIVFTCGMEIAGEASLEHFEEILDLLLQKQSESDLVVGSVTCYEGTLEDRANRIEQRRQKYSEYEQKCLEEIEQLTKQRDEALEKQEVKK